jgi:hypothetical protein
LKTLISCIIAALILAMANSSAAPSIRQQPVQFEKGATGTTIEGQINGEQIVDYTLFANAGQVMVVHFNTSNAAAYFNIMPPGSDVAIFIGSTSGNEFSAELKATGVYTVRVYLMRNAARRNETANYTLDIAIAGDVLEPGASDFANAALSDRTHQAR